jgi:hypothetical protein
MKFVLNWLKHEKNIFDVHNLKVQVYVVSYMLTCDLR